MEATSAAFSPEVKLCDICGAVGYDEFLAVCTQCNERVEHVYCMQALSVSVPPNWVCEGCKRRSHTEVCEEQNERLLQKINIKTQNIKTPFLCQEKKSQNEQCIHGQRREEVTEQTPPIHGQEREEVKEQTSPNIVPSEVFSISVSAEGALQASAGDAKGGCATVGCEISPSKDPVGYKRFHHGLKGLASSKPLSCANHGLSKSNLPDRDPLLSFLLPSRPKELPRSNSRLSNKKAGLPPDNVKVTADAYNEHLRKEASLSASGLGIESTCQQSCRDFSHKSQRDMTVEAGWKCDNSSQVSHQSKSFSGNQKDMVCIEASKARQHAREEEAEVMETTSRGKTAFSGSKQLAPETTQSFEMVHAGTVEKENSLSFLKNGSLELQKPPPHSLLGRPLNVSSGTPRHYAHSLLGRPLNVSSVTPRYYAPQFPVPQGGSHALAVSNEWQLQPRCFHQPQVRPWRPNGHTDFMPLLQSTNYAYELNVSNGDYLPPQLQAVPHVQKVWRGCFDVSMSVNRSMVYNGIQAHPSNNADPKVWEAAKSLPGLLKMKELKRGLDNNTWPRRFLDSPPTSGNIGMFFFPVNMESHDAWYKPLANRLIGYDLVLRAESASLYLLIFHSQLLPKAEQMWDGRHYLWGVFRTKKSTSIQRATMVQSTLDVKKSGSSNGNGEIVDMDIDMVGGAGVQPATTLVRGLSLPPLPPGSPPAKPPPPPHSDEDGVVSLCSKGLSGAPPPIPPQCQQEIILESRCDLSALPKHKPAAGQDAAEPRRRENCSVSSLKKHDGGAKSPILSNISADDQPEQPNSHGDVTSVARESVQPALQTSGETLCTSSVKEMSKHLKPLPQPLHSGRRNKVESRIVNSPSSAGQISEDNPSSMKKASLDNLNYVFRETTAGREFEGQTTLNDTGLIYELESSSRETWSCVAPEEGQASQFLSKYADFDLTFSLQGKICAAPNELADIHTLSVIEDLNKGVCNMDDIRAFRDISVCQQVACLPLFPIEESSSTVLDTTGILADVDEHLSDASGQAMPLVQQLDEPWYRPPATSDGGRCIFLESAMAVPSAELTLLFPQYRKHGNMWIKIENDDSGSCRDESVQLTLVT